MQLSRALAVAISFIVSQQCIAETFFNLDFEAPAHTVGLPPATGTTSSTVSSVVFGSPQVVDTMPLLDGNSLEFEGLVSYEQIRLVLGAGQSDYKISFDLASQNLRDSEYSFTMLLDTPAVRNFSLHGRLNSFRVFPPGIALQSFSDNTKYHVDMFVDLNDDLWSIDINGANQFSGSVNASEIESIRFSLAPNIGGASSDPSVKLFLDNVIVQSIPEPSSAGLLLAGIGSSLLVRKRNCDSSKLQCVRVNRCKRMSRLGNCITRMKKGRR